MRRRHQLRTTPGVDGTSGALAKALQAELHGAHGDLAAAQRCASEALAQLEPATQDLFDGAGTIAGIATTVALDAGNHALALRATTLPLHAVSSARHRVQAHAAAATTAFMRGDWDAAHERLLASLEACRSPEAGHLVGVPLGLWIELAMSLQDDDAVQQALARIEALPQSLALRTLVAPQFRAQAWRALRAGQPAQAFACLIPLCSAAHRSRLHGLSRLDAAWLACEAGRSHEADQLIRVSRRWISGSPLGRVIQARRWQLEGPDARAATAWTRARESWPGHWPAAWRQAAAGLPPSRSLPSVELRAQLTAGPRA